MHKVRRMIGSAGLVLAAVGFPWELDALNAPPSARTAEGAFSLEVRLDAESRTTAQSFEALVTVEAPIEARLTALEPIQPEAEGIRIEHLASLPMRAISPDRLRHSSRFRIHPYLPGTFELGAFRAQLSESSGEIELISPPLRVNVVSVLEGDPDEVQPASWVDYPVAAEADRDLPPARTALWLFTAGLAAGILLFIAIRRRNKAQNRSREKP